MDEILELFEIARAKIAYLSSDIEWRRLAARLQHKDELDRFIDRTALETAEHELERWCELQVEIARRLAGKA